MEEIIKLCKRIGFIEYEFKGEASVCGFTYSISDTKEYSIEISKTSLRFYSDKYYTDYKCSKRINILYFNDIEFTNIMYREIYLIIKNEFKSICRNNIIEELL